MSKEFVCETRVERSEFEKNIEPEKREKAQRMRVDVASLTQPFRFLTLYKVLLAFVVKTKGLLKQCPAEEKRDFCNKLIY